MMNNHDLKIPGYTQYVTCPTRGVNTLDHFYCNQKNAYRSVKCMPIMGSKHPSDHNMIFMQPTYSRKLKSDKPKTTQIMQCSQKNLETLNASFDHTDWDLFVNSTTNVDELADVITEYIKFNTEMLIPTKTIRQYPNCKPWINSSLRKMIVEKHSAFSNNDTDFKTKEKDSRIQYYLCTLSWCVV